MIYHSYYKTYLLLVSTDHPHLPPVSAGSVDKKQHAYVGTPSEKQPNLMAMQRSLNRLPAPGPLLRPRVTPSPPRASASFYSLVSFIHSFFSRRPCAPLSRRLNFNLSVWPVRAELQDRNTTLLHPIPQQAF